MNLPVGLGIRFLRGRGESGGIEPRPVKPVAQNWKKRESGTDTRREPGTYRIINDHA